MIKYVFIIFYCIGLDIFNYFISFPEYSYLFSTLIIFLLSVIPILTPPTWMVVVSAHMINPTLDPIILSILGASAAIGGTTCFISIQFIW